MRVVFYIHNIGDYHAPRLLHLQNHLSRQGIDLLVIEGKQQSSFYAHTQNRARVLKQQLNTICLNAHSKTELMAKLVSALFKYQPDVVLQLGYHEPISALVLACAKLMGKSIFFMSDSKKDDHPRKAVIETIKSFLVRRFDGALVAGERHRAYFTELGMNPATIEKGYDVVDNVFFSERAAAFRNKAPLIKRLGIVPKRYVLVVSRLVPRKRVELAVEIYAKSDLPANDIDLLIIGDGPRNETVHATIAQYKVTQHVHQRKNVANKHMPLFYAFADAMILASEYDQWGLSVNEAMACGTPVLLTERCGAANEIVQHNINGFVWDGQQTDHAVRLLNQMVLDPMVQSSFRAQAVVTIQEWGPERFATALCKLILNQAATSAKPMLAKGTNQYG